MQEFSLTQDIGMKYTVVESAALTDTGLHRSLNEDSIAVVTPDDPSQQERGALLVVADGLGGYNAGEVASALVANCLPKIYFEDLKRDCVAGLLHAVEACNKMVNEASLMSKELRGMGTTVVAAVVVNQFALFANVGDSRGYLFRDGSIIHRTKDHSLKDASVDVPGFASTSRFSHVLTRALGPKPDIVIDVTAHRIAKGDRLLLCSDGLSDYLDDDELKAVVCNHSVEDAAAMLINLAKERGGEDNISAIVAHVRKVSSTDSSNSHLAGVQRFLVS
jgi:protein phosphatase